MRYLNMSTIWMMSLCIAVFFLKDTEAADVSLLPSPEAAAEETISCTDRLNNGSLRNEQRPQLQQCPEDPLDPHLEIVKNNEKFMKWRNDILEGISGLPKNGKPGRLIVFGRNAEPILTGSTEEDVFIAAAEFGKGRIVAMYQDCSNNNFSQYDETPENATSILNRNIKIWLTKGTFKKDSLITDANVEVNRDKLMSSKIVIYQGNQFKIPLTDLTEFVRNGGALLHCFGSLRLWLLMRANKGKMSSVAPYMALMIEAGIVYTADDISAPETGFLVSDNKAKDAHMLRTTIEAEKNVSLLAGKKEKVKIFKILIKCGILQLNPNVTSLLEICTKEIEKFGIPSPQKPAVSKIEKGLLKLWFSYFEFLEPINIKAPGVNLFPGDFTSEAPLKNRTIELHVNRHDYHSTGCYLPAGKILKVEVISGNHERNWDLLIGCHTDILGYDICGRWPYIYRRITLSKTRHEISSPFGGSIYLISPNKPNLYIKVKLENVVDSPQFRLTQGDEGNKTWEDSRQSPGLWADIVGELVTITMPSSSVRDLEYDALASVMKIWDSVVRLCHDLRGTNVSEYQRQWLVTDVQPSMGYMHSGYPIVTQMDVADPKSQDFFLNGSALLKLGNWGAYHEIGHNTQRAEWSFEGAVEVTANIFTLYVMDKINHFEPSNHSWFGNIKMSIKEGSEFRRVSLLMYAQLAHEFGWESYKKVFRLYEAMNPNRKPKENQAKIDTWFVTFSEVVEYNLAPLAHFWNISLSSDTVAHLQTAFPVGFLPDDDITRSAPERVNATLLQFPTTVRKVHSQE